MITPATLKYVIKSQAELNLSFLPFIQDGGLFVPTNQSFNLGAMVNLELQLPAQTKTLTIESKVVWITPKNALYYIFAGVGVQFTGANAKAVCDQIKAKLDNTQELSGYVSGINSSHAGIPK